MFPPAVGGKIYSNYRSVKLKSLWKITKCTAAVFTHVESFRKEVSFFINQSIWLFPLVESFRQEVNAVKTVTQYCCI